MRPEKPTIVEDIKLRLNNSPFLIVVDVGHVIELYAAA
jgi:hypothetical protein